MQDTLEYHWGKHHRGYVTTLNGQIKDKPLDSKSLEEVPGRLCHTGTTYRIGKLTCLTVASTDVSGLQIVLATWNDGSPTPEFNPAAQIWNHEFFWDGMSPNGGMQR